MPGSAPPERLAVERELEALEEAVARLLAELSSTRRRAETAERKHEELSRTLSSAGVAQGDAPALERRLKELTEENGRLRAIIGEARERAERIRGRLRVIEDETA